MRIETRRDLASYFEDRMNKSYTELTDEQRLGYESSLVKTYMVEAHLPGQRQHADLVQFIQQIIRDGGGAFRGGAEVHESDEELFLEVQIRTREDDVSLYVDASDPRFWLLHSMHPSRTVDWCVERLISATPQLDRAWLPVELLEWASTSGSFRGLGLNYDRRKFVGEQEDGQEGVTFLKMQLWGNRAKNVLEMLRETDAFPHETTLSKVKVKFWLDGRNNTFSLDDIKFNGKITARGTSFQSHLTLVTELYRRYARALEWIESKGRIQLQSEGARWRVRGSPVQFKIPEHVASARALCEHLFTCGKPFRLWGVPIALNDDYFKVSAVDLHVGHPLDFEITKEWMRVYLHEKSCGNTIVRLLTNLQHSIDARAEAEIDGQRIPDLQSTNA